MIWYEVKELAMNQLKLERCVQITSTIVDRFGKSTDDATVRRAVAEK